MPYGQHDHAADMAVEMMDDFKEFLKLRAHSPLAWEMHTLVNTLMRHEKMLKLKAPQPILDQTFRLVKRHFRHVNFLLDEIEEAGLSLQQILEEMKFDIALQHAAVVLHAGRRQLGNDTRPKSQATVEANAVAVLAPLAAIPSSYRPDQQAVVERLRKKLEFTLDMVRAMEG